MANVELKVGTRVYNNGDICNQAHFGTITEIKTGRFGTQVEITPDEGSDRSGPYWVTPSMFCEKFLGHGGTRFVTEAAYREWRQGQVSRLMASAAR